MATFLSKTRPRFPELRQNFREVVTEISKCIRRMRQVTPLGKAASYQFNRRSAGYENFLQFPFGEERDPAAVGREEYVVSPFRAGMGLASIRQPALKLTRDAPTRCRDQAKLLPSGRWQSICEAPQRGISYNRQVLLPGQHYSKLWLAEM